jgi:hypothetical protein
MLRDVWIPTHRTEVAGRAPSILLFKKLLQYFIAKKAMLKVV